MKTARTSMAKAFVFLASRTILPKSIAVRSFTPSLQHFSSLQKASFSRSTFSTAMGAAVGPRQVLIEERLNEAFSPAFLEVQNTSHGQKSDESHFKVVVVSEAFEGVRLIGRHRAINKAVAESDGSLAFHSLEIGAAKTPSEWNENSNVAPSPQCKGGDGRGPGSN